MKVALFAVLLFVGQAAPPASRQVTDQAATGRSKKTAKPQQPVTSQNASQNVVVNNPTPPNAEQAIKVRELPSVSVTRDWIDKAALAFSLILVIAGIGGVWVALRTLNAMYRALRVDQRAWMGVVNIKIRTFLEPDHDFVVEVETKNTGKTPALRVLFHNRLQALLVTEQLDRTFGESTGHGTVMPDSKQIHSIGENHSVPAATVEHVENGTRTMYLHGRIEYQDIFGNSHWTNWCFRLAGKDTFVAHNEYNDTDDAQVKEKAPAA